MNVLTIGTFDTFHVGHLELLEASRAIAGGTGQVIVAVNRDAFIERFKGRPPVQSLAERLERVRSIRFVDAAVVNIGDEDSRIVIDVVAPDLLTIGDDWLDPGYDERRYFSQLGVTSEWMAERDLRVTYIPRTRGRSSSALRDAS